MRGVIYDCPAIMSLLTFTTCPFNDLVASRWRRWDIKNPYLSSLSSIGAAVCTWSLERKPGGITDTHIKMLSSKYYHLIELRDISKEIIHARPFRSSPPMLTLGLNLDDDGDKDTKWARRTSHIEVTSRSSTDTINVYGFWCGAGYGGGKSSGHAGSLKY